MSQGQEKAKYVQGEEFEERESVELEEEHEDRRKSSEFLLRLA